MNPGWLVVLLAIGFLLGAVLLGRVEGEPPPSPSLADLQTQLIPAEGTSTPYGIALSLDNAQLFADWYYAIRLTPEEERIVREALHPLPTPCCDDTRLTRCCCEEGGRMCNLVRSARGLAAWLLREKRFSAEEIRASVAQWLRFVHPTYYLAQEVKRRGGDPSRYGLPTQGACYRGACEVPLREGGCGGMGLRVKL